MNGNMWKASLIAIPMYAKALDEYSPFLSSKLCSLPKSNATIVSLRYPRIQFQFTQYICGKENVISQNKCNDKVSINNLSIHLSSEDGYGAALVGLLHKANAIIPQHTIVSKQAETRPYEVESKHTHTTEQINRGIITHINIMNLSSS